MEHVAGLTTPRLLALALVIGSANPVAAGQAGVASAVAHQTSGSFVFADPESDRPITVWFCRPPALGADTRIVFVMHGSESKTARQACDIASSDIQVLNAIVLAPQFSEQSTRTMRTCSATWSIPPAGSFPNRNGH
jgi:poly(3-hydroxybutyrate) depolymerase